MADAFSQAWRVLKGTPENMFSLTDYAYDNRQTMHPAIRGMLNRNPNAQIEDLGGQVPAMSYAEINPSHMNWINSFSPPDREKEQDEFDFLNNQYRTNEYERGTPHEALQDAMHPQRFLLPKGIKPFYPRLPVVDTWKNPYKESTTVLSPNREYGTGYTHRYGLHLDEITDGVARDDVRQEDKKRVENFAPAVRFRQSLEDWKRKNNQGIPAEMWRDPLGVMSQ